MIGNLTVDKASLNFSYFLKSVMIISDNGGKISRRDFVAQMADYLDTNAENEDGKENRTPYNKLKQVMYFGFAYIEKDSETSWLCLTPRGELLAAVIEEDDTKDRESRYYVSPENIHIVRRLFAYDIIYNSFGRNNCGAEQSNTDTEPPKVIVKLLSDLEYATSDEICYAIYALNGGKSGDQEIVSWDEIKNNILQWRDSDRSYETFFSQWGVDNIVKDYKILNLLASPSVDVILEENGKFYLSGNLERQYVERFKSLNHYYTPIVEVIKSGNDLDSVVEWVQDVVINRPIASGYLKIIDIRSDGDIAEELIQLVGHSLANNRTNYFFVTISDSKENSYRSYGDFERFLDRISDVTKKNNGESSVQIAGLPISKFPANFHTLFIVLDNIN